MNRKQLQKSCEKWGQKWVEENPTVYGDVKKNKKKVARDCKKYIKANVRKELEEQRSGSLVVSIFFPLILEWVVKAIIRRLTSSK